ncbi:MAG: hypothetical protein U5M23_13425 [Marinagarivorans sp.]|nr:hypothetical protein [Marinagarivorans sp.]
MGRSFAAGCSRRARTTLSGKSYLSKIARWKALDYKVVLFYFSLPDVDMAIMRVKHRVANGGHNIPVDVIKRRFGRSVENLKDFKLAVDSWVVFDSSLGVPQLLEEK